MARNRITGRETQKMQEYTQGQISQAERRGIEFPTDVKEQLFEYANLIGEEEKVRTLVRNLADAVIQADEEGVEDLLDDARMDIQDLPDPTIGKLELRDYGYTAEDLSLIHIYNVKEYLPESYNDAEITLQEVEKNNGLKLTGLSLIHIS